MSNSAEDAVRQGLLAIAPEGQFFPSRSGNPRNYVVDARGAGSNLRLRESIVEALNERLASIPDVQMIGGIAKSGIVWGAWLAWRAALPYASILLDGKRASGLQRETEGDVSGKQVVLIDNWVRTGSSIEKAAEVVRRNGGFVADVIVITNHDEPELSGIRLHSCWSLDVLFQAARTVGVVPANFEFQ